MLVSRSSYISGSLCLREAGVSPEAAQLRLRGLLPRRRGIDHAGHRDAVALGGAGVQRQASPPAHARNGGESLA